MTKTKQTHFAAPLINPKHEAFALARAGGKTQEQAYIDAGYSVGGARKNASRLMTNDGILTRIQELQAAAAARNEVNHDSILADLEKIQNMAVALGQSHAAIIAVMSKAKLLGLL
jgi:phage terminase small subunit